MTCSYKSQHNFYVKNIYAKITLPIYLAPHLEIFLTKNNIFIWKIKEARKVEKPEKIRSKHADTETLRSFQRRITSLYEKLKRLEK
jgi:uncharacterized membrane protein